MNGAEKCCVERRIGGARYKHTREKENIHRKNEEVRSHQTGGKPLRNFRGAETPPANPFVEHRGGRQDKRDEIEFSRAVEGGDSGGDEQEKGRAVESVGGERG